MGVVPHVTRDPDQLAQNYDDDERLNSPLYACFCFAFFGVFVLTICVRCLSK